MLTLLTNSPQADAVENHQNEFVTPYVKDAYHLDNVRLSRSNIRIRQQDQDESLFEESPGEY